MTFHSYQSCRACQGSAKPGTRYVMEGLIIKYPYIRSLGIYSCRNVAGTSTRSIHSCGRAGDPAIPTLSGGAANRELGHPPLRDLIDNAEELGIMGLIYDRVRYDARSPRGRYYGGAHPHWDHIHYEQTDAYARYLTRERVYSLLGIAEEEVMKRGDTGRAVAELQHVMSEAWGRDMGDWDPVSGTSHYTGKRFQPGEDGDYGPATETQVKAVQKMIGLPQTGITDGVTSSMIFAKVTGVSVDLSKLATQAEVSALGDSLTNHLRHKQSGPHA